MNRIDAKFESLKKENKKAFIAFVTGGDPSVEKTEEIVLAMEEAGADIIEIGIPYSDPLADGPVIQAASQRALLNGVKVKDIMEMVGRLREKTQIPLLFLVYYNTIYVYGKERFAKQCKDMGIDGLIIPDLPLEERHDFKPMLDSMGIANIPLVAPTSKERVKAITEGCNGFVYCVSSLGVTGRGSDFHGNMENYMNEVRSQTDLPLAIGFGITTKQDLERLSPYADGLIVGSAIVRKVEESNGDAEVVKAFVKELLD